MLTSKRVLRAALIPIAAVLVASCGDDAPETAATVNGVEISSATVDERADIVMADPMFQQETEGVDADQVEREANVRALNRLVSEVILESGADELGIEVGEEDIDSVREQIAAQFGGEDEMYEQLHDEMGLDREAVDREIRLVVVQDALVAELGGGVTDTEVDDAYEQGTPARHILVEDEAAADQAMDRIAAGEDFADVAQEVSVDGSAASGGDLGFVQPGMTVPEFEDALFSADEGEVVGPVESQFGFHVIERLEKPALADVEAELRTGLEQQALQEGQMIIQGFIDEQSQAADVTVDPHYGYWDAETGRVVADEVPEQ